jgi:hypothetical protein
MVYRNGYVRRRRGSRFSSLYIGLFLLGMALLFGAIFVYPGWRARLSGVQTQGTVVSVSDCPEDTGGDMVLHPSQTRVAFDDNVEPVIRFTDGQGHTHDVQYDVCGTYDVGETLAIWYVPSDPNTILVPDDMGLIVLFTFMFGIMGLIGLVMLLWFVIRFLFLLTAGGRMAFQGASAASYAPQMGTSQMGANQFSGSKNHRIGQPVTVEGRWSVLPTRAYPSQGDLRATPAPGRYFLMVMLSLRNISQEPLYPGQGMFHLYDNIGTEYTRVQALESPLQGHIQPGGTAALTLAFDVPGTQRQFRLSYASSTTLLTEASWDVAI